MATYLGWKRYFKWPGSSRATQAAADVVELATANALPDVPYQGFATPHPQVQEQLFQDTQWLDKPLEAHQLHAPMLQEVDSPTEQSTPSMAARAPSKVLPSIAAGYASVGVYDELTGSGGAIEPHWQPLLQSLDVLNHEQRLDRIDRIKARVRETGIAHDLFADPLSSHQPWRLDLIPLILPAATWAGIEAAVTQRARLHEALLADVYGPQTTMKRGLVPSQLIFNDPGFLRACHNIEPSAGRILFYAVDLARSPDGSWVVVDTHTETPAGIGYALANRTVLTHVSGEQFAASKAIRLAAFFQQMQESLARRANRADPSIALLTPGPRHVDFFSHAYLARYLGLLLVEGDDLRIDNDRVHLKTLGGLQPIDLLVRCVAGGVSDALELDPSGFLGPVGLVNATRLNPNTVVNSLGTALAENRGLGGYLPALCKDLLGEDLLIGDVTKWWLGDPAVRAKVVAELDTYFIRRAYEQTSRPGRAAPPRDPSHMSAAERAELIEELKLEGAAFVAEKKTTLGTTPSYSAAGLEPKPFALRVFATSTPNGFAVMPGGLAMTVNAGSSLALTSPDGASHDVWVVSDTPQPAFRSLWRPAAVSAQIQRAPRELPSRAADNLFWLGRQIERTDWTFRVLRNCLSRIEEDSGPLQNLDLMRATLTNLLDPDGSAPVRLPPGLTGPQIISHLSRTLMTSTQRPGGLPQTLGSVHRIASQTRDRLSLEAWRTLNAFYAGRRWQPDELPNTIGESLDVIDAGLGVVAAFNGLSHENMTRNFGWSFLDLGRRMSRAANLSQVLVSAFGQQRMEEADDSGSLLFVLELADSFITYRSRYRVTPALPLVLDLLIADETNPRSLAFQLAAMANHIDGLPQTGDGHDRTSEQRTALAMLNDLRIVDVQALTQVYANGRRTALETLLNSLIARMPQLTDELTRRYFSVVETAPRWNRARSRQSP